MLLQCHILQKILVSLQVQIFEYLPLPPLRTLEMCFFSVITEDPRGLTISSDNLIPVPFFYSFGLFYNSGRQLGGPIAQTECNSKIWVQIFGVRSVYERQFNRRKEGRKIYLVHSTYLFLL